MSDLKNTEENFDTMKLNIGLIAMILAITFGLIWGIGGPIKEIKSELKEANQNLKEANQNLKEANQNIKEVNQNLKGAKCFSLSPEIELLEEDYPRVEVLEEKRDPVVRLLEDLNGITPTR